MPRRPRVLLSGYPRHILLRGINGEPCFFTDEDYHFYLHWLEESACACCFAIHAHSLMTNHVHLLLTPKEDGGASWLMQALGCRDVRYANRFHRPTGSLWEGRYKSSVVQTVGKRGRSIRPVGKRIRGLQRSRNLDSEEVGNEEIDWSKKRNVSDPFDRFDRTADINNIFN